MPCGTPRRTSWFVVARFSGPHRDNHPAPESAVGLFRGAGIPSASNLKQAGRPHHNKTAPLLQSRLSDRTLTGREARSFGATSHHNSRSRFRKSHSLIRSRITSPYSAGLFHTGTGGHGWVSGPRWGVFKSAKTAFAGARV